MPNTRLYPRSLALAGMPLPERYRDVRIACQTDAIHYLLGVQAEPSRVVPTVRRPAGGQQALSASWSYEAPDVRVSLSAYPEAGTSIDVRIHGEDELE